MPLRKSLFLIVIFSLFICQHLYASFNLHGVVQDNALAPVENALVELIDQADTTRVFSSATNAQGQYSIQVIPAAIGANSTQQPGAFNLMQNYPNPFNPSTVIGYEIPHPAHIRIDIYNVLGQKIKTLFDGFQANLAGRVIWDATNEQNRGVSAGVYIYSLVADGVRINRKMLLLDGHLGEASFAGLPVSGAVAGTQPGLHKKASDLYLLRVSGADIVTQTQQNIQITGDTQLDITVIRAGSVTDIDGNEYRTVKIGEQWWMAENLKVTHYRNGDAIPNVTDDTAWRELTTGAYCNYDNDENHVSTYGRMYNGYAVTDPRNIAPPGWHVPTDEEWKQMLMTLGMSRESADSSTWIGTNEGGKLKESGTRHWASTNSGDTNETGFTALPGGFRNGGSWTTGGFENLYQFAWFWTRTESGISNLFYYDLFWASIKIYRGTTFKAKALSVRLVKNNMAPAAPTLVSPVNNAKGVATDTVLSWNISGLAVAYTLQIATDPDFTTLHLEASGITATSYQVSRLAEGTTYYWRVNGLNDTGTSDWSEVWHFRTARTIETGSFTDIDGNVYQTVKIGEQWWMAENFKVTHYRNGDAIPNITDDTAWRGLGSGAYCNFDNNEELVSTYGRLYNGYAVTDPRKIAPAGWHVSTDEDWKQMLMTLGMSSEDNDSIGWIGTDEGGMLKEIGTSHWLEPNEGATNETGFTALPGGKRSDLGTFTYINHSGYFWTETEYEYEILFFYDLFHSLEKIYRAPNSKRDAFSIRLVKGEKLAPAAPTLASPANNAKGIAIDTVLSWNASSTALTYTLQVATDSNFTSIHLEQGDITDTSYPVSGLANETTYYWRVNGVNEIGTGDWSEVWHFKTMKVLETGSVTDIDGNVYKTVKIGEQWWMAENFKVTHYRNGDAIPNITDNTAWSELTTGAYCNYDNNEEIVSTYGRLYNWYTISDLRNIAPAGWHVPTDEEWKQMLITLGVSPEETELQGWIGTDEGGMLKEISTSHWLEPNVGATNETGFTALPGGYREFAGEFKYLQLFAHFWSSTQFNVNGSFYYDLFTSLPQVFRGFAAEGYAYSIRLVKD